MKVNHNSHRAALDSLVVVIVKLIINYYDILIGYLQWLFESQA